MPGGVILRVTGNATFTDVTTGSWAPVQVGNAAVWETELAFPGTMLFPDWICHLDVPNTCSLTAGSIVKPMVGIELNKINACAGDVIDIVNPTLPFD